MMIDKKPEYKGESKVWEILSDNLPDEAIVYNGREVNGREFVFLHPYEEYWHDCY